jgi:hypothetical protein
MVFILLSRFITAHCWCQLVHIGDYKSSLISFRHHTSCVFEAGLCIAFTALSCEIVPELWYISYVSDLTLFLHSVVTSFSRTLLLAVIGLRQGILVL